MMNPENMKIYVWNVWKDSISSQLGRMRSSFVGAKRMGMESCNSKVFEGRLHGDLKKKEGKVKKRARGSIAADSS